MFMEPRNRFRGIDFASLCSLADRYDKKGCRTGPPGWESILGLLKSSTNTASVHKKARNQLKSSRLKTISWTEVIKESRTVRIYHQQQFGHSSFYFSQPSFIRILARSLERKMRRKTSQIINHIIYLPFYELFILWIGPVPARAQEQHASPSGSLPWTREGLGESQFRRRDIHCGTLYIYVLCGWINQVRGHCSIIQCVCNA